MLAAAPMNAQVIISVTTDTGIERARKVFGARHTVVRYPFDFSWSVRRFLGAVKPDVVLLMELEIWPNFTRLCANRSIPIAVINGRLSAKFCTFNPRAVDSFANVSKIVARCGSGSGIRRSV